MMMLVSLRVDRARVYTPLLMLSVTLFTLRAVFDIQSWIYFILETLLFLTSLVLSVMVRVFDIPHRYALHELKYK